MVPFQVMYRCRPLTAVEQFLDLASQYAAKKRSGVAQFSGGLEAYLLPDCALSRRLLKTAALAAPLGVRDSVPSSVNDEEMLLLFVHRRVIGSFLLFD